MLRQTSGPGLREPQEALREADVERDVELGQRAVAPAKGCARPEAHGPSRLAKALCSQDVSGTLAIWDGVQGEVMVLRCAWGPYCACEGH